MTLRIAYSRNHAEKGVSIRNSKRDREIQEFIEEFIRDHNEKFHRKASTKRGS